MIRSAPRSTAASRLHVGALIAFVVALGCDEKPDAATLSAWHQAAVAADEEAAAAARQDGADKPWQLAVTGRFLAGQVTATVDSSYAFDALDALATTHVRTVSPQNPADLKAEIDYRGLRVRDLLARHPPAAGVDEVTFVAYDAFRSTVPVADLQRYDVSLATAADGKPIPRGLGGPVFLVFPYSDHPDLAKRYQDRWWVFYVTHVVVGTAPLGLDVAGTRLVAADFAKLPRASLTAVGRYKVNWPSKPVRLEGVLLKDVVARSTRLADRDIVVIGMSPIHRDPANPVRISRADVANCGVLVADRMGPQRRPITAKMGGPLVLVIPPTCAKRLGDHAWVTFVQGVEAAP